MEVYIEYVILDNFIMDWILLKETAVLLKHKSCKLQLFIASLIGTAAAVIFPLLRLSKPILFILKIFVGALISFIAASHKSFIRYIKYYNVFLLTTFLLGGAVIAVFYALGFDVKSYGASFNGILPVGINFLFGYLLVKIVKKSLNKSINGLITDKYRYKCTIKTGLAVLKATGYFDSGNLLLDRKSGLPVALCRKNIVDKLKKRGAVFPPPYEADFSTVSGDGKILLYEVDAMLIETQSGVKRVDCLLGLVSYASFSEDLLLGAYFM